MLHTGMAAGFLGHRGGCALHALSGDDREKSLMTVANRGLSTTVKQFSRAPVSSVRGNSVAIQPIANRTTITLRVSMNPAKHAEYTHYSRERYELVECLHTCRSNADNAIREVHGSTDRFGIRV